jgi:hypothetical protein
MSDPIARLREFQTVRSNESQEGLDLSVDDVQTLCWYLDEQRRDAELAEDVGEDQDSVEAAQLRVMDLAVLIGEYFRVLRVGTEGFESLAYAYRMDPGQFRELVAAGASSDGCWTCSI